VVEGKRGIGGERERRGKKGRVREVEEEKERKRERGGVERIRVEDEEFRCQRLCVVEE